MKNEETRRGGEKCDMLGSVAGLGRSRTKSSREQKKWIPVQSERRTLTEPQLWEDLARAASDTD